eukprot:GDKJ01002106.1.p1 GENE.GDKJ01002106.1~~GDKJ01002106.1.p1  ORF type:complete len:552 (+),score=111.67 GDKJ01002106.1:98-1753(+)
MLCPRFLTLPRDDSDCCPMSHGGYFAESSFFVFCSPYKEVLKSLEPHVIELYFERLNSGDVTACGVWENNPVIAACGHFYDLTSQVHSIPRSIEWDLWIKADIVSNRDFTDLEKMCIVANGFVAHGNAETGVYEQKIGDAFHRVCKLPASKFGGVSVRQWLLAYSRALAMLACIEDPEFESQSALDDRLNHEQSMHRADNFFYSFPVEARNVRQSIITSSNRIHRAWRAILVANGRMSEECKTLPFVPPLFLDVKSTRLSPGFLSDILVPTLNKWGFHITSILSFDLKQLPHYPPCQTSSDSTNKNKEEEEEEEIVFSISGDRYAHIDSLSYFEMNRNLLLSSGADLIPKASTTKTITASTSLPTAVSFEDEAQSMPIPTLQSQGETAADRNRRRAKVDLLRMESLWDQQGGSFGAEYLKLRRQEFDEGLEKRELVSLPVAKKTSSRNEEEEEEDFGESIASIRQHPLGKKQVSENHGDEFAPFEKNNLQMSTMNKERFSGLLHAPDRLAGSGEHRVGRRTDLMQLLDGGHTAEAAKKMTRRRRIKSPQTE